MQKITVALWACLLGLLLSCKKDDKQITPVTNPVGVATAVGTPDATPLVEETIDETGGSISSQDGRINITIPAGALDGDQQISIQSISNHNPLAIQKAFRLSPHGVHFKKPVTIEFSYTDEDVKNTIPEALGIAYQDAQGIWQAEGGVVIDKVNQTAKITTNHFSDWTLFESFYLLSSGTMVNTNGTVQLEVVTTEDILASLVSGKQVPMGKKVSMPASAIKEWQLNGAGNLQRNGAKATYRALATVPGAPNPVAVSVRLDLKQRGTFLLLRHIEVQNDDGEIEIRVAGNNWVKKTASIAVRRPDGHIAIADSDGDTQGSYILIQFLGSVGTHTFKEPTSNVGAHIHYHITDVVNYSCFYINGNQQLVPSGGGITVTSMGEDDGFIKGTFKLEPAGYGDHLNNTINIEGKFRVRRGFPL
ncbi:MAG: hypothetical protein ACXWV0_04675 [Flavisolibacter sp.]